MESKLGAVFGYMVTAVASPALRMYVLRQLSQQDRVVILTLTFNAHSPTSPNLVLASLIYGVIKVYLKCNPIPESGTLSSLTSVPFPIPSR